jgi:hypothetical protein
MNLPSPETKKPWPFALKCPVSSKTETIMTAGRIDCATSAKSFVGACEGCAVGATIDSTGTEDVGDGEGSGARTVELLRPHEAKTQRVRMKYSGTRRMRFI